jgi:hypothetical protein
MNQPSEPYKYFIIFLSFLQTTYLNTFKQHTMNNKKQQQKQTSNKESPIMLEKLLCGELKEPNVMSSPNAFDWEKRLAMPGGSPNAFALSLNGGEVPVSGVNELLFDYPNLLTTDLNNQQQQQIQVQDHLESFFLNHNNSNTRPDSTSANDSFSEQPSIASMSSLLNPLPTKRTPIDRKDSHRESERRRRETFKASMFHLENLVILTLNRGGSCKVLGKGPNRKLAHSEVYRMARDIIVTLKEEIQKVEQMNHELTLNLQ